MDTLDSRSLHNMDCFAQKFSTPGQVYYRISKAAGSCLPVNRDGALTIDIKARAGKAQEVSQHNVTVRLNEQQLIAETPSLKIEAGDTVLWNTSDPRLQGFAVQGEGPDGVFDSTAMTRNAVYTHAFGTPGEYKWVDANGSRVSGIISVRSLDLNDSEQCKKWLAALSKGTLILIQGEHVDPERAEILTGQTVFWAVEEASGISITDSRLIRIEKTRE
jgi:plastocyanin